MQKIRRLYTAQESKMTKQLYSVWHNTPDNDLPVAIDCTAEQCAAAMGVSYSYFKFIQSMVGKRSIPWIVIKTDMRKVPGWQRVVIK